MARKKQETPPRIALCYVRQSYTRNEDDMTSPERQRANIQRVLETHGYAAEWFEDVDGHKSGRYVHNRPGWLALMKRLEAGGISVLIANDLSRLHRKGWRVGDLIDHLEQRDVDLIIAEPGREVDTTTPMGRMFIYFTAIFDEYYSSDIAQRAKSSITHRKNRGITIGITPFGTVRGGDGLLQPSPEGAWLLPDGCWQAGVINEDPPQEDAQWRSYFEAAEHMLRLYSQNRFGLEKIAYQLHADGYAFRDRKGQPRPLHREDVRRVVANWPEYGGIVSEVRAKDRPAYEQGNVTQIPFVEERAVMDLDLLRDVARVRHVRSVRPEMNRLSSKAARYPLSNITCCAHCEAMAKKHRNPNLRSYLTGTNMNGTLRYRHKPGVSCGSKAKSVRAELYEADFKHLLDMLAVNPEMYTVMMDHAKELDSQRKSASTDMEAQRRREINLRKRRIAAAIDLYAEGVMDKATYQQRVEVAKHELAFWEEYRVEREDAQIQLQACLKHVQSLTRLWDIATGAERQQMIRYLFSYVVYNLDTQRIVDFRLQPWADHFLVLRAAVMETDRAEETHDEGVDSADKTKDAPLKMKRHLPPRGFEPRFQP